MYGRIDFLDKGYVILQDFMGSDLSVVNSARVSYNKKSHKLTEGDKKLIKFLAKHGHTSPFRHAFLQFEIYAPLMVCRQHWKYISGSSHQDNMVGWNETSRRYVTEIPTFYVPSAQDWRSAPENSKQGSGAVLPEAVGADMTERLKLYIEAGELLYESALNNGVCAEQARLFLPAYGLYVRYYWSASLQGVCHFLNQRLKEDSQVEIQELAKAVYDLAQPLFPESVAEMVADE